MAPVRTGIIGLGRAGWGMIASALGARPEEFKIVAGADVIPGRVERLAAEFGAEGYADYRALLADPNVELVVVATRSNTHVSIGLDALASGKHVLLEKPFALTLRGMDRLLRRARRSPGTLIPRHNRRFDPDFVHVRELLATGVIGEVREVKLYRHGFNRRNDWQTLRRFGGGQLANWGPHIIDHALRFLGAPIKEMYSDLQRIAAAGDAEDHVKIVLTGRNGRVVDLEISGGAALGDVPYRVFGTLGALTCDGKKTRVKRLDPTRLTPVRANPATPRNQGFGNAEKLEWIEEELEARPEHPVEFWNAVYAALHGNTPFPVTLAEARQVVRVMELARRGTRFEAPFTE
ncbi:MAG: Gfo/Idh/MocA family oxidoreductase [Kiritimatiellaeota bacterium]|nr:Gfo/Idh/MocA family oxidoreductase [Kiritimatiellota bacterium]